MPTNTNIDTDRIKNGIDRSSSSFRDAQEKAGEVVENVKEGVNTLAASVRKTGSIAMKDVSEIANKAYSQVSEMSRDGVKKIEEEIKHYPLTALIGAFSLGALFGVMCRSSK